MDILERVARSAGEVLLKYKGRLSSIKAKSSKSDLVSEADYESQKIIFEMLERFKARLIGEENYSGDPEQMFRGEVFLIDPLDGTLNYVHGLPFYSISIARLKDGEILEGVVYLPETGEMFHALLNEGAFLNGSEIKVSSVKDLEEALLVTGWPYDEEGTKKTYKMVEIVNERVQEIRILGSCAAELSYLAAGRIDGYFEIGLGPWDMAGGYLIATEAGAVVTSISHEGFSLIDGEVLASVPEIHGDILNLVREALDG